MKLYLIRHGETVDNVAGLYAGVRDSALTNHGAEQARRLGEYLADTAGVRFTHVFSSPLARARKTAESVVKAQERAARSEEAGVTEGLEVKVVQELIEQDFGSYEGKPFHARNQPGKMGQESHRERHKGDAGFRDVESRESMSRRADAFLEAHLLPLFSAGQGAGRVIAITSHGMLLSTLWRRLLVRLPRKSVTIAPEVTAVRGDIILEYLGGWSNTGYLELEMSSNDGLERATQSLVAGESFRARAGEKVGHRSTLSPLSPRPSPPHPDVVRSPFASPTGRTGDPSPTQSFSTRTLTGWSTTILAIDSTTHLQGVKRQKGGIGRIAHDEGQKKLDGYFKRQKLG